jgi:hypothetical protein
MQPWAIGRVLALMLDTFVRRPFAVLFVLGFLPAIWTAPAIVLQGELVPADTPLFGPGRSVRTIAISWMISAWTCIWFAGQISAAVDLARGDAIRWRAFVTGVRKAPVLFLAGTVGLAPLELLNLLPLVPDGLAAGVARVAASGVTIFVVARTILWAPLIVESTQPFWVGLATSWTATRGHFLRLVALAIVLTTLVLPLFIVEAVLSSEHFQGTVGLIGAIYLVALGRLYVLSDVAHAGAQAPAQVGIPNPGTDPTRSRSSS